MRADTVRNRAKHRRRERGVALVMVLLAIVVLTVFLTDVQQQSATAFASAITARERLKAEYHARSAVSHNGRTQSRPKVPGNWTLNSCILDTLCL